MRFNLKKLTYFFIFILFISCSKKDEKVNVNSSSDSTKLIIGTFNLEWLGDGINDRKDRLNDDYQLFAKIIKDINPDIMGLQEVENSNALKKILQFLPEYDFFVGNGGNQQNLAIIYKKSDIKLKIIGEYEKLAVEYRRTRPGLVFEAKKNNFDFIGMVVHLKSTSRYDYGKDNKLEQSYEIRTRQNEVLSYWVDSLISNGNEKDLIIIGDFNDTPIRKKNNTMNSLLTNNNLLFLTDRMKSCKYKSAYTIDHILITQSAFSRFIKGSEKIFDLSSYADAEKLKQLSDHCPIISTFNVLSPDNDPSTIAIK